MFYVHPIFGEDEPILTHIFQMRWFNHQLLVLLFAPDYFAFPIGKARLVFQPTMAFQGFLLLNVGGCKPSLVFTPFFGAEVGNYGFE